MKRWRIILLLAALFQFALLLDRPDITTAHEGRVAATAAGMLHRHDWLVPYLNDEIRLRKPPLPYWAVAASWRLSGTRSEAMARLPGAMAGAIAVLLMMDLARRTLGGKVALVSGLLWIGSFFVVSEYRKTMADPYLAFFALLAIWAWITRPGRLPYILLFYVSIALGCLAKGPLILLHVGLALIPYCLLFKDSTRTRRIMRVRSSAFRRSVQPPEGGTPNSPLYAPETRSKIGWAHVAGLILFLLISLPWPIYIIRNVPGALDLWRHEALGDPSDLRNVRPWWHYAANLPLIAAPWSVLLAVGMAMPILNQRRRDHRLLWPTLWLCGATLVFTFVPMKKNAYLLPEMPAIILLASVALVRAWQRWTSERDRLAGLLLAGHALVAMCAALGLAGAVLKTSPLMLAASALAVAGLLRFMGPFHRGIAFGLILRSALVFALAVHILVTRIMPAREARRSPAGFAMEVRRLAGDQPVYLVGWTGEEVLYYLGGVVPRLDRSSVLNESFHGYVIAGFKDVDVIKMGRAAQELASTPHPSPRDRTYFLKL